MKFLTVLAIAFFTLTGTSGFGQNKTLPSVNLKTLDGQSINLTSFVGNGKTTVISVWASWCAPCKKELDTIAKVYKDWQADYNVELVAITIDTERQLAKVKPMVESRGWTYTILSDTDNQLRKALGVASIPRTFAVNDRGEIIYDHTGYSPGDENKLKEKLVKLSSQ